MTTTLPGSISGLLRRCSPVIDSNQKGHVVTEIDPYDGWVRPCGLFLEQVRMDIGDQTGFHHALLWLGAKYGVPTDKSLSFHAMHDPQPRWSYPIWGLYADGEPVFSMYDAAPGHAGFGPRALLIPGCKGLPRLEALRLAVLAVAGVQV